MENEKTVNGAKKNLIYRLRNYGYRIDTKKRIVYLSREDNHHNLVDRLVNEFGFAISTDVFSECVGGRVFVIADNSGSPSWRIRTDYIVGKLLNEGYLPCVDKYIEEKFYEEDSQYINRVKIEHLVKSDIVYFCKYWGSRDNILLLSVAEYLNKKIVFE